jgi:hypothetical protein
MVVGEAQRDPLRRVAMIAPVVGDRAVLDGNAIVKPWKDQ